MKYLILLILFTGCGHAESNVQAPITAKLSRTPQCVPNPDPVSNPDGSYTDTAGCQALVVNHELISTESEK